MEVVIDVEFLKGVNNEDVGKEVGLASDGLIQSFHFQSPYIMHNHRSEENGLNFNYGHIPYQQLYTVLD
jgi:hypothetical protein